MRKRDVSRFAMPHLTDVDPRKKTVYICTYIASGKADLHGSLGRRRADNTARKRKFRDHLTMYVDPRYSLVSRLTGS